ncbi:VanW family protein [Paenibacillus herberti]|uniref:VanW family protein n=1 Tax=Paenibacillus herberti TaxID=1619309 RepID=UPI001595B50B|nr:VanW family protein [Paenibacillus herberti]
MKRLHLLLIIVLALLLVATTLWGMLWIYGSKTKVPSGTNAAGLPLGGLRQAEALHLLEAYQLALNSRTVTLADGTPSASSSKDRPVAAGMNEAAAQAATGDAESSSKPSKTQTKGTSPLPAQAERSAAWTLAELGLRIDLEEAKAAVARLGTGSVIERAKYRWKWDKQLPAKLRSDRAAFDATIRSEWGFYDERKPVDAVRIITPYDQVVYTPGRNVLHLDLDRQHASIRRWAAKGLGAADAITTTTILSGNETLRMESEMAASGKLGSKTTGQRSEPHPAYAKLGSETTGQRSEPHPSPSKPGSSAGSATQPSATQLISLSGSKLLSALGLEANRQEALQFRAVPPKVTLASLKAEGVERLIASFTTDYRTSSQGRAFNVSETARTLNGWMMKPGEVFDYGEIIRITEHETGYREAPVILNGQFTRGVGGGICQVSSTLYNVALRAGLEIVERRNHSLPVSYLPKGQDATFAEGSINFRFRNTSGKHLFIRTYSGNGQLTIKLFGTMPKEVRYSIVSRTVRTLQAPIQLRRSSGLAPGQQIVLKQGRTGYVVETYRIRYVHGNEESRTRISRDTYKPKPSIIMEGPASAPLSPSPAPGPGPDAYPHGAEEAGPAGSSVQPPQPSKDSDATLNQERDTMSDLFSPFDEPPLLEDGIRLLDQP